MFTSRDWGSDRDDATYIFQDSEDEVATSKTSSETDGEGCSELDDQEHKRPMDQATYDHGEHDEPNDQEMYCNDEEGVLPWPEGGLSEGISLEGGTGWQAGGKVDRPCYTI
jgi:hypothetical protein